MHSWPAGTNSQKNDACGVACKKEQTESRSPDEASTSAKGGTHFLPPSDALFDPVVVRILRKSLRPPLAAVMSDFISRYCDRVSSPAAYRSFRMVIASLKRCAVDLAMRAVGVIPVAEAGKDQEDETKPQNPAPAEHKSTRVEFRHHKASSVGRD